MVYRMDRIFDEHRYNQMLKLVNHSNLIEMLGLSVANQMIVRWKLVDVLL